MPSVQIAVPVHSQIKSPCRVKAGQPIAPLRNRATRGISLCAFLAIAALQPRAAQAQKPVISGPAPTGLIAWARSQALPVSEASAPLPDLKPLIRQSRVVALGEPAHGAHQPLEFRNRLFRELVEKYGFTAIGIESGLTESHRVDRFVQGGEGDPEAIAHDNLSWGFGNYRENVELITWIRNYNSDPAHARKIHFYGIDLSGGDPKGGLGNARVALDELLAYLERAAPASSQAVRDALKPFVADFTHDSYLALPQIERPRLKAAIGAASTFLRVHRDELRRRSGADDFEWALRNAIVAGQIEAMFRVWPAIPDGKLSPELARSSEVRDRAMAANALWALGREGPGGRLFIFAHDAHVANAPVRGGLWKIYKVPPRMMGQHLRAALGRNLVIMLTSASANGGDLPRRTGKIPAIDAFLSGVGVAPFLLDLRGTKPEAASRWLGQLHALGANYTTEIELRPVIAADALVHVDTLTPASPAFDR